MSIPHSIPTHLSKHKSNLVASLIKTFQWIPIEEKTQIQVPWNPKETLRISPAILFLDYSVLQAPWPSYLPVTSQIQILLQDTYTGISFTHYSE